MDKHRTGFTILELMIATMVFSVILLLCMVGVTRMGRLYYKGITQAKTQEVARQIMDDVVSQIQFGNGSVVPSRVNPSSLFPAAATGHVEVFCIGDYRYKLTYNVQKSDTNNVLLKEKRDTAGCDLLAPFLASTPDLAPKGTRISRFDYFKMGASQLYNVDILVTSGENDLLIKSDGTELTSSDDYGWYGYVSCKGGVVGAEFCATSGLSTSVMKRISDN